MKSVLISVQPKWCEKIKHIIGEKDGTPIYEKSVEVRKTKPKIDTPFKCYIYETKGLYKGAGGYLFEGIGKVIGEFICDEIYPIKVLPGGAVVNWFFYGLSKSCLSLDDIAEYIGTNKTGYGWHISNLVIYDKPKELSEFHKPIMPTGLRYEDDMIKRPPQSWCYVEGIK